MTLKAAFYLLYDNGTIVVYEVKENYSFVWI